MLAIVYVLLIVAVGDAIVRRFYPILSIPHRYASAFLVGLLASSWYTYLLGRLFANSSSPLLWANLIFFGSAIALIYYLRKDGPAVGENTSLDTTQTEFTRIDWVIGGIFMAFAFWMMFRTFTMTDGSISIGHHQFPDFGATLSLMQSFALGNNFPTEFTHFTGDQIRYHFLFYFQAGNLEYLGLSPVWANNLLSAFSLTSLLVCVMTLGSLVFRSRTAGRIGAALFFFHGSLAFIPFLMANPSFAGVMDKLSKMTLYLNSGLPYRGEDWGVWSQNVFLNQRHFSSAIAMFLLVLIFLFVRFREYAEIPESIDLSADETEHHDDSEAEDAEPRTGADLDTEAVDSDDDIEDDSSDEVPADDSVKPKATTEGPFHGIAAHYTGYIFSGVILGLLPMWNGAVFLSAAVVLALFLLLFPRRKDLIVVAVTSAIIGLPQYWYLVAGSRPPGFSMFRWGFSIDNAGLFDVLYYNFFTFGFKWILIAIALYFASGFQRRFFAAIFALLPLTFCFRFSEEVLTSHKFLNVWLVIANLFVAFALVKLWGTKTGSTRIPMRVLAVILAILVTIGGAIDLFPIWNSYFINMKYKDDPLIEWVKTNTEPKAIFLSHRYINHQILLAGRKIFFGDPYYAWGIGYDVPAREQLVRQMFETNDPAALYRLLKENNISYVAVDDMARNSPNLYKRPNEAMLAKYFPVVFNDERHEYANIKIYKVPDVPPDPDAPEPSKVKEASGNLFETGDGIETAKLSKPRGITVDTAGNIYVADTGNARVQKFDAVGKFISMFGERGDQPGQLQEPNGVSVDAKGNIYITDAKRHKLLRLKPDGQFDKEWDGPPGKFYGPRDILIAPNRFTYVIDQGGTRIAKFDPATETFEVWGAPGSGESEFNEPTGIAIGDGKIFVADAGNNRVQVFDLNGRFGSQFEIPSWERFSGHFPDLVFDEKSKILYVSNGKTNEIMAFKPDGMPLDGLRSDAEHPLDNPSAMVITGLSDKRKLLVLSTETGKVAVYDLDTTKAK
ncbi:MAG: NHL repeat-containing protein [Pyrinomonadaceae bacterium]